MHQCRVLDLGIITAGAATSAVLADLGAEVIKIESPSYQDPFRKWSGETFAGEHPDLPPFFRMTNRGKLNAGIDLKHPHGREVFLRLVAKSDIVVENFSRGVLERLGLDYQTLKAVNPDIILASISSQGEDGPDRPYVSFGSTLEAMAGLAAITGYAGGPPVVSGIELNFPDQVVAIFASAMITTAWFAKENGAGGAHLDMSQRELTSFLCGEAFLTRAPLRQGNAQDGIPLQECFRSNDGVWVAVTVYERNMRSLRKLTGGVTAAEIGAWIASHDGARIVSALEGEGVAAAAVADGTDVLAQWDVSWSRALKRGADGDIVKGFLFEDDSAPMTVGRPAVLLGADTRDVLIRVGGYSNAEIDALVTLGAVASESNNEVPAARDPLTTSGQEK
ncbi:CaiB/BaiF CoA transferase family protein [Microvirga alba]|uniref:CoA transferase n=1 Tax=Microvirga alba TaxID=2791025 RepID=A0A931BS84_9HYPH|nr:CoA transferase [Microvirga alba]MBF9233849.1 CoA transferase [Microvirga alba]